MAGMRRRIQATGGGSYVVTLPKEWVVGHGLDKGSEVEFVFEADGSLRLVPVSGARRRRWAARVEVGRGSSAESVLRRVISFYIAGADVIEVVFEGFSPGVVPALRSLIASKLLGVEVVEESSRGLTFQVIGGSSMDMLEAFTRLARTVEYMLRDIAEAIGSSDERLLGEIPVRDDIVDKLFIYVSRQAMSVFLGKLLPGDVGMPGYAETAIYMTAAKHVERIGDHATRIAQGLASDGLGSGRVEELARLAELYRCSVRQLLDPDPSRSEELIEEISTVKRELGLGGVAGESARRVLDYCTDILELSLNLAGMAEMLGRRRG